MEIFNILTSIDYFKDNDSKLAEITEIVQSIYNATLEPTKANKTDVSY